MRISKGFFKILFLLTGIVSLYIGVNFFIDLHHYFQLSAETPAEFENWEVEEVQKAKYIVVATYHFKVNDASYRQRYRISKPCYPNVYLANKHLEKWKMDKKEIWFNPKNPHQSSIMRPFPFKKGIHLLLCFGILFYFLWLNFYVRKMHPDLN